MSRVLILSASAGSGHLTAASALEQQFLATGQVSEVRNVDALEFTSDAYKVLFSDLYFTLVKRVPWLVGLSYEFNNTPFGEPQMMRLIDQLNAEPLIATINAFAPDITVCTHYMPAKVISFLMARGRLDTRLFVVTTDFDFQGMWLSSHFHRYFVATEETQRHMARLGLPEERVVISGIPVSPVLGEPVDRAAVLERFQLQPDVPIILISAGAAGGDYAREIVAQTMELTCPLQAVVVCGKNKALWTDIGALVAPQAERFRVLGYTDEMPDLIRVADLFVGKPGGLTAAECMAAGLPMVIINPIPGQEERNSDLLLEQGAAVRCNYRTTIGYKIERLICDKERLARMRRCAAELGRPDAAAVVVQTVLADTLDSMEIDSDSQRTIAALATAGTPIEPEPASDRPFALYIAETGVLLGHVTEDQLFSLREHLEEEHPHDDDYYLNSITVEMLRERGIHAELLAMLERVVADSGEGTVRWARR